MEYGVIIPKGISRIRKEIPLIREDAENGLTVLFRELLNGLYETLYYSIPQFLIIDKHY